jgi:acetyl-CoA carboxylase biotin carboxyl carrier protein
MKFDKELIQELMEAMGEHQVKRIFLKNKDEEIEIEKEGAEMPIGFAPSFTAAAPHAVPASASQAPAAESAPSTDLPITSPFVGTFYAASSPQDDPFVKEGDHVDEESVVCIVEAMKVMNEVKAGVKGRVTKVLLKNGDPVEFGTEILHVDPS